MLSVFRTNMLLHEGSSRREPCQKRRALVGDVLAALFFLGGAPPPLSGPRAAETPAARSRRRSRAWAGSDRRTSSCTRSTTPASPRASSRARRAYLRAHRNSRKLRRSGGGRTPGRALGKFLRRHGDGGVRRGAKRVDEVWEATRCRLPRRAHKAKSRKAE